MYYNDSLCRKSDGEVGLGIRSYQMKSKKNYFRTTLFGPFCWFCYLFIFSLNVIVLKSVSFCRHIFCNTYSVKKQMNIFLHKYFAEWREQLLQKTGQRREVEVECKAVKDCIILQEKMK